MYGNSRNAGGRAFLLQMLSLHLLLLAFFIALYNHSRVEDAKARKVAGSIHATFSDEGVNADRPEPLTSLLADALAADFRRDIGRLVRTEIPIAEIDVIDRGRVLRARMPVGVLFAAGSARLRDDRIPLIRRIARALDRHPPGYRYDLQVAIGSRRIVPAMLERAVPLEVKRAATIGAALQQAGAPEGAVAVGVDQGGADWATLTFQVRTEEEGGSSPAAADDGAVR